MSTTLVVRDVWKRLSGTVKASRQKAAVAVAYFGQGAASLLPLRNGSHLVVDASEGAVKSGQTCPTDLKKLARKGVRVFSVANLHAKVFVVGGRAFVGSANVSRHSAQTLVEALVESTEPKVVEAARAFVENLALHELGIKALDRLASMYRPPKIRGAHRPRTVGTAHVRPEMPRTQIVLLERGPSPEGSEAAEEAGRAVAKRRLKHPRRHELDEFNWHGNRTFSPGDVVVQVVNEDDGAHRVSPPANVIHVRRWSGARSSRTFVYLEIPKKNRKALDRLAKQLGRGAKKRLQRNGVVRAEFAEKLLEAWSL